VTYSLFETAPPLCLQAEGSQPLHLQLKYQIASQIRSGAVPSGTRLPPVRRLADALGLNRNTVLKVYAGLEQAGLVVTRVGSGTFVADVRVEEFKNIGARTRERLRQDLIVAVQEGATVHELRLLLEYELGMAIQNRNARSIEVIESRRRFAGGILYSAQKKSR
jgi:DNA-binding transcriptional regulator YhcF (GntR family)